jgi:hypothetical protein
MTTLFRLLLCVFCVIYFLAVFYSATFALSYFYPLDTAALAF